MTGAVGGIVKFSTGDECYFDLRYREVLTDDGQLPRNKKGLKLINLPCGETAFGPYDGEKENIPSKTEGKIPVYDKGDIVIFNIKNNKIIGVDGEKTKAEKWNAFFSEDPARANLAEFAFGCNPKAVVWGNVLEDEKAGFHWAFGRSDHLGGTTSPDKFKSPENVIHQDIVYAKNSPIQITEASIEFPDGKRKVIISDKEYVVF